MVTSLAETFKKILLKLDKVFHSLNILSSGERSSSISVDDANQMMAMSDYEQMMMFEAQAQSLMFNKPVPSKKSKKVSMPRVVAVAKGCGVGGRNSPKSSSDAEGFVDVESVTDGSNMLLQLQQQISGGERSLLQAAFEDAIEEEQETSEMIEEEESEAIYEEEEFDYNVEQDDDNNQFNNTNNQDEDFF